MRILGEPVPEALPSVVRRVGAIVESPQFFAHFSGERTLCCWPAPVACPVAGGPRCWRSSGCATGPATG